MKRRDLHGFTSARVCTDANCEALVFECSVCGDIWHEPDRDTVFEHDCGALLLARKILEASSEEAIERAGGRDTDGGGTLSEVRTLAERLVAALERQGGR